MSKCRELGARVADEGRLGALPRRLAATMACTRQRGAARAQVFVGEDFINSRTSERHCVNSVSVRYVKGTDPQVAEETVAANK